MASDDDAPRGPHAPASLEPKETVDFESFVALDLRVGRVTDVEDFPDARIPAYKLTVDFGPVLGERRTAAQIKNYDRADLLGRMVVGAVNLGTKRIAGFDSQFLVLGALEEDGTVHLLDVDGEVPSGSTIA